LISLAALSNKNFRYVRSLGLALLLDQVRRARLGRQRTLDAAGMRRARHRGNRPAEAQFRANSTKRGNSRPPQAEISAKSEA